MARLLTTEGQDLHTLRGPLLRYLAERQASFGMTRLTLRQPFPATHDYINVERIELEKVAAALRLGGGNQGRAAAAERIQDDALGLGAILDGIHHKRDRLDGRVGGQLL